VVQETQSEKGEHLYDFAAPVLVLNERRAVARIGISFEQERHLPLCVNMNETLTPRQFRVEGEKGWGDECLQ